MSLFDSLSTTLQIIVFVLMLTTKKPIKNSLVYLGGLSGSYFLCGIAGFQMLDSLNEFVSRYFPSTEKLSNANYYLSEFVTGAVMIVIGIWYFRKKRHAPPGKTQNFIVSRLVGMNSVFAGFVGIFMSVTSFPVSVPYILSLKKYTSLGSDIFTVARYVFLYNVGYTLPMIIIFVFYIYLLKGKEDINDVLHEKTRVLNVQLTTWAFIGFGLFSIVDAGFYYLTGHALVNGRFL
jgi:cytochrome c biogenesis protein CcdA